MMSGCVFFRYIGPDRRRRKITVTGEVGNPDCIGMIGHRHVYASNRANHVDVGHQCLPGRHARPEDTPVADVADVALGRPKEGEQKPRRWAGAFGHLLSQSRQRSAFFRCDPFRSSMFTSELTTGYPGSLVNCDTTASHPPFARSKPCTVPRWTVSFLHLVAIVVTPITMVEVRTRCVHAGMRAITGSCRVLSACPDSPPTPASLCGVPLGGLSGCRRVRWGLSRCARAGVLCSRGGSAGLHPAPF